MIYQIKYFPYVFLTCHLVINVCSSEKMETKLPKIGIIGGGIGGTSCAFFLRSFFGKDLSIDLFEPDKIGGRLSSVNFGQKKYEEGGSIIHPRNKYMVNFAELFQLSKRETDDGYFGLYDGNQFVFSESKWKIVTAASMLYRYGFGFFKLEQHINDLLDKFGRIYKFQEEGRTYNNVTSMLAAMDPDFVKSMLMETKTGFKEQGIPQIVVDEIVMATIRANYGQNLKAHKFVGSVSVAGGSGNLWAIRGGNSQVPKKLLETSRARVINKPVTSIRNLPAGNYKLTVKERSDVPVTEEEYVYDVVVIAAPQTADVKHPISFQGFDTRFDFPGRYHRTICTLIKGTLRENFFLDKNPIVDEILTTNDKIIFNSIGRITPIDFVKNNENKKSDVWKIFSQRFLTDFELTSMFSEIKDKYVKDWLAYPHYETEPRLDSFVLDRNLYHVNAIEWAASAMEMSVIGARNVALLALKNWRLGRNDFNARTTDDDENDRTFEKTEL